LWWQRHTKEGPAMIKDWKKEILTVPNMLSLFRLILIPVYILIYLNATEPVHYFIAAGILAVSCLTDLIDGKIARHFNMMSKVGQILDPLADKLTQFSLAVCLALEYPVIWLMVCLIFVKEIFQLVAAIVFLRKGQMLKGALFTGKMCTTILFTSLILLVLIPPAYLSATVVGIVTAVDILFLLIAFVDYVRVYAKHSSMIQDLNDQGKKA
jgi:cardiolipin synthase